MDEKKPWFEKTGLLICLLIFLWPFGLIGLFLNKKINKVLKIILITVFLFWGIIITVAIFAPKPESTIDNYSQNENSAEEIENKTPTEEKESEYISLGKWMYKAAGLYFEIVTKDNIYYIITRTNIKNDNDEKALVNKEDNKFIDPNNVNGEYYKKMKILLNYGMKAE